MAMTGLEKRFVNRQSKAERNIEKVRRRLAEMDIAGIQDMLELGCGIGAVSAFLSQNYPMRVTGTDYDPQQIELARVLYPEGERLRFQIENAADLSFTDASFDLVISQNVFHHVPAWRRAVREAGWVILWISAAFGWLPIFTFRKWGGVPQGKSYVHTTVVVDRGLYAIVRHPQYLAGILLGVGLGLVAQNWIVAALGVVVAVISYTGTIEDEAACLEKFGEAYAHYMGRVPRVNFVLGVFRWLKVKANGG